VRLLVVIAAATAAAYAADYRAPAGTRYALRRPGAESIIPGGRVIGPHGRQGITGPAPFGLAVSASGKYIVTADSGPDRYSLSVLIREKDKWRAERHVAGDQEGDEDDWRSIFMGLAFASERDVFASEGNSGRVRRVNVETGRANHIYDLNQGGFTDSFSGDLAFDSARNILYVVDQANFRVAVIDARRKKTLSSVRVGRLPFSAALSPDGRRLYVANLGMFEYKPLPGADPKLPRETGLPFPPFGFPSPEARDGVRRDGIDVPGLGDPNAPESNSLAVINVENPAAPRVEAFVRTGVPFGKESFGGSSPSGVTADADRVFVSNGHNDSITVIDARSLKVERDILIRIPGLEAYRGILPIGLALHPASGWLLVAEAGINAVGIIDIKTGAVLGHVPAGWFPSRVVIHQDDVWVSNAKGVGTGPNATRQGPLRNSFQAQLRRGTISLYPIPAASDLPQLSARVMAYNGFRPAASEPAPLPAGIRHVVLIVKENRTFDEVFGDIQNGSNGPVAGAWDLARFGRYGTVVADRDQLQARLSLRNVNVTPNHHEMASRWSFSDNFYADSEMSLDGHHWLVGAYPNAWTETSRAAGREKNFRFGSAPGRLQFMQSDASVTPENQLEGGALWHHLERHGISFRNWGEGFEFAGSSEGEGLKPTGARFFTNIPMPDPLYRNTSREYPGYNTNIPDQFRATQFIAEVKRRYIDGAEPFPRFIFIHLPNDHIARPRPNDGYPFRASYVADNDYALGRIVEFLSETPWWKEMAIFITEDDAQGGVDHIDSHRTVMLLVSPFAKKNYVSHVHSSFPGLLKTIFRLFGLPPLNLYDATASDLADCFTDTADATPYKAILPAADLFDPAKAREPLDPQPPPTMDSPSVLLEQHSRGGRGR
jgi:DNA-binding beta-propeller fold protein YncE